VREEEEIWEGGRREGGDVGEKEEREELEGGDVGQMKEMGKEAENLLGCL